MARKDIFHTKKSCGAKYEVEYTEDDLPYLKCTGCGHELRDWVKWEQEYRHYWQDPERWKNKNDGMMCVLGYFCHRYEEHYGMPFALSLNERGLFRGPEVNILRRVYKGLGNSYAGVRHLIDWYFAEKIQRRKKRITSLSFLATPFTLNEFKLAWKKRKAITRDKPIPAGMLKWVDDFAPAVKVLGSLKDYGDLKTMLKFYKLGHIDSQDMDKFVEQLEAQKVIDSDYEIIGWRE